MSCQKMLDNSFCLCYNRTTIGGRNMEIVEEGIERVIKVMERLQKENKR